MHACPLLDVGARGVVYAGDTRFATLFIMLQRWVDSRKQLQTAILDDTWHAWKDRGRGSITAGAEAVEALLADSTFSRKADDLLKLIKCAPVTNPDCTAPDMLQLWHAKLC